MHHYPTSHYPAAKEIPFTFGGQNLKDIRRARLRLIAKSLGLSPDGPKNELLHRIVGKLRAMGSEGEIGKL